MLTSLQEKLFSLAWWKWIVVINTFLVTATVLKQYEIYLPGWKQFDLAKELNFAAWWSGICLFTAALLSYETFCNKKDNTKTAWLIISMVLLGLSWDEMGSLHERIFAGSWANYIPYAFIGLAMLTYALIRLFLKKETTQSAFLILCAFILFGSVALQEYIEHALAWAPWMSGIRVGVEEGTELLGTLLCLFAIVPHTRQAQTSHQAQKSYSLLAALPNPLRMKYLFEITLGGLAIHTATSFWVLNLADRSWRGNPALWFPVAIYVLMSFAAAKQGINRFARQRVVWLSLSASFLMFAMIMGCSNNPIESLARFSALYTLQAIVIALLYTKIRGSLSFSSATILLYLPFLILLRIASHDQITPYIYPGLFAFVLTLFFLPNDSPISLLTGNQKQQASIKKY